MKFKQLSTLTISTLLLSGCSFFNPSTNKPDIDSPEKWQHLTSTTEVKNSNLPDLAWWEKFNDPQLNTLMKDALENNNNIQTAIGNIIQAEASVDKANYSWLPTAGIGGSVFGGQIFGTSFENKTGNPLLDSYKPESSQNFSGYSAGFAPSYTLNILRQIKMGNIADLNLALQIQAKNAVRLAIISQVAGNYFNFLGLKKQLQIQNQMLNDAKALRKYTIIQYEHGQSSEMNVKGLDQFISMLDSQIPSIQNDLVMTQNALRILTNKNPGKIITKNNFDNINTKGIIPVNLPSEVLKSRPDIAIADYQLQMTNEQIAANAAKFFPSISLTGMVGDVSMQLTNLFSFGAGFWSAALGAAMPVLDMGIFADIDKSKGEYYSAYYNYIEKVRTAFMEVDNGLSKNKTVRQEYQQQETGLMTAEEQYQLARIMYEQGAISYSDTLAAKLNTDYMLSNVNKSKIKQMNSIVNLYDVLGGGYNVNNTEVSKKFDDEHDV
jgi:NodT family efflux transporter outer membrane factor (OMF) lipoprotein